VIVLAGNAVHTLIPTNLLRRRGDLQDVVLRLNSRFCFSIYYAYVYYTTFRALRIPLTPGKVMYRYRDRLPVPDRLRAIIPRCRCSRENYAPLSTFSDQAAAGITSSTFDIEADNIFQGDARVGLDEQGTQEVMEIMRRENVT
jgi:hypothetical protein